MLPGRLHSAADLKPGTRIKADVAVVGSGAGGAAVAAELAKNGLKVAVLEEGRSFAPSDLVTRPSWAYRHLYAGRSVLVARGEVLIPLAAGRAVGGSTFVNSAICFRAPDRVLREWERDFGSPWTPDRMAPLFDEVERALDVQKIGPEIARHNSLVFKRGAEKLGLDGDFISRNAPGCVGCGVCQLGCPIGGKGSVDKNLLPAAIENGADVYSEVRARDVRVEHGVAKGVTAEVLDRDDQATGLVEIEAERVFLCGGAFGTPQLLQRNRLCNGSGQVGENLHVHPGQAAAALFDEEIRYWDGVTQGYYVHLEDAILETFTGTPELFWAALPLGQMNLRRLKHVASAGCMIRDRGRGRVRWQGEGSLPAITYEMDESDRALFIAGARAMARVWFAAGAHTSYPLLNATVDPARSLDEALRQLPDDLPARRLNPYGSHPQSTCRMSADPRKGVCKPTGETHEVENLYVADGSLFPTALGVNPQITILALATGIAREMVGKGA
ncbi:MAG: FAD-dependent oxidoreductase [Myxococcales bacterium]|nr:GMC family oxidoreductase [Myxococcales bacterium]